MKTKISRISPHATALTSAAVLALLSIICVVPMSLFMMISIGNNPAIPEGTFPLTMFLLLPVLYFIAGYIFTGLAALIYNQVVKLTGGIEVELTQCDNP